MGSPPALKPGRETGSSFGILDDSGQLSIDFYIGLSIFLISLIVASTMISGLLIGLQSKQIDYDAVAYRTGVILVEDPGEPNTPFYYKTITEADEWEFIGIDQKDQVRRFGLTLYKSTPRTLSPQKIISFDNTTRYPSLSEYRERIIFGSVPYRFNITLKILGEPGVYQIGEEYPPEATYGYIRRVVLVKNQTYANVNMSVYNTTSGDGKFYVDLNYTSLLDPDRAPHYWVEAPKEDITINLTNVQDVKTTSEPSVELNTIRIRYVGRLLGGAEQEDYLPIDVEALIDNTTTVQFPWGYTTPTIVNSTIKITFPAGYFIPPSAYANIELIHMKVSYEFNSSTVNITSPINTYYYDYTMPGFSPPYLKPAVMEVRIW